MVGINIRITFLALLLMLGTGLLAQPYDVAPRTKKKVHRIIEWISPSVNSKSTKGMVSTFDRKGNLTSYTSDDEYEVMNTTYLLDKKGRPTEVLEGKGSDRIQTKYTYQSDRTIKDERFRGKHNRIIHFYDKKGKLLERKSYSKGLELGNRFRLKEQVFYKYNSRDQLITESYRTYNMPKSKDFLSRKKSYYYHTQYRTLLKTVEYDYDNTASVIEDYAYNKDKTVKSIITSFVKDDTYATKEILYKKGKIWQRITTKQGIRHVEVFVDGRLIRLRSYNGDKIYRVVDYQYEYY